jgi:flagellar biosynthesis protein FlhA
MPLIPFALLSLGAGYLAWRSTREKPAPLVEVDEAAAVDPDAEERSPRPGLDDVKIEVATVFEPDHDLEGRRLTDQSRRCAGRWRPSSASSCRRLRILDNMRLPTGYGLRIKERRRARRGEAGAECHGHNPSGQRDLRADGGAGLRPAGTWIAETARGGTFRGHLWWTRPTG